ncbi:hypothetical protein ACWCOW_38210 [Streptomyces sp. NPDC001939]
MLEVAAAHASPAMSVTIPLGGPVLSLFPAGRGLALPGTADPLQQLLARHDIRAQVTVIEFGPESALRVALATEEDGRRLAALVIARRSAAHDAVLRLRDVFASIGITQDHIYVADGLVEVGDISVQDAITLYNVLAKSHGDEATGLALGDRWEPRSWRDVEKLAELLSPVVGNAAGEPLDCTPHPACRGCIASRPHQITLGSASPRQVLLLAESISSSGTSRTDSDAGPPAG